MRSEAKNDRDDDGTIAFLNAALGKGFGFYCTFRSITAQTPTPDQYQFIKGAISEISDKHVAIWPYGETKELVSYFVHGVSEFWQGGLKHQHNLLGEPGDQGGVTTFRDDNGNRLVERLFCE